MNNEQCFTKITNKDLEQLIACSISTKESNLLPTAYERSWLESLKYKELEIEGYVRADHFDDAEEKVWTRYIPNKPHTHPESGEFVLTCVKGDMEVLEFKAGAGFYYYNEELGWTFVDDPYFPLFWRHLPQPPKELKESPRWRPLPPPLGKEASNEA